MIKRLISFLLTLVFLVAIPLSARYKYNPYTRKLDWYEPAADADLGDLGDVTLTGMANGDILYYNGTAWVNLTVGAGATVLTVAGGIPSWAAPGAPAAHAASHEVGGADLVDHDQLTNYLAAQHLTLPNTIVAVLTDHNLLAHTALGLFDASGDVDHDLTTNYLAAQHLTLPNTIVAVLTDHTQAAHNALNIDADTVDGEHAAAIVTNARVKAHFPDTIANILSDHNLLAHTALGLFDASGDVDHDLTTNYAANQHVVLPNTIANVLSDHNLAAHTALGLFDASADVDHDATTNWVANKHINWTAAADNFSTSEDFFLAWTEAADHAAITQTAVAGIEDQPLIYINDDRTGVTAGEVGEATIVIEAEGVYALYVKNGHSYLATTTTIIEDFHIHYADSADYLDILQTAVAGIEDRPLFNIDDDRTGATANELSEATIHLDAAGVYAFYIAAGDFQVADIFGYDYTTEHTLWIGYLAGEDLAAGGEFNTLVGEQAGANITTGDYNTALGYQSGQFYLTGEYNTTVGWQAGTGVATNNYSDNTFIGAKAGFATTTGSYTVAVGSYALNSMTTAWYNVVVGAGAASALIDGANNTVIGSSAGVVGTTYDDDVFIGMSAAYSATTAEQNVVVGNRASYFNQTGGENVVVGYSAAEGVITKSYSQNVIVGSGAAFAIETGGSNVIIGYQAAEDLTDGTDNIVIGYMAGEGWLDTETNLLVIDNTDTATPLIYGDFTADNITINGDFNVTMDAALDQIVIAQSAVEGPANEPLIFIDDDRTGVTADGSDEATIYMDTEGRYALYILDGWLGLGTGCDVYFVGSIFNVGGGGLTIVDDVGVQFGTNLDVIFNWILNGAEDALFGWNVKKVSADDSTAIFMSRDMVPTGMDDHNDYLSPTFIMTNDEGADTNDYSGVVIGERTQADVKVAHYFDFYAMTGASDGSVDGADEVAAIFRFGAAGTAIPDNATTPGDVLFEGNIEVNGMIYQDGGTSDIKVIILKVVAHDVAIPGIADGVGYVTIPVELNGFDLVSVGAHVYTPSDTGAVSIQIHNLTQTDDMLTTNITIDQDEWDSIDAAVAPVIDGTKDDVATGNAIRVDIDASGANGAGLEIRMGYRKPL